MLPVFPSDLSTLSDAELAELLASAAEYGRQALAAGNPSAEVIAELTALNVERERALAEQARRADVAAAAAAAADEQAAQLAALQAAFTPAPAADPAPADTPAPAPAPAATPPAAAATLLQAGPVADLSGLAPALENIAVALAAMTAAPTAAPAADPTLPPIPEGAPAAAAPIEANWSIVAAADVPGYAADAPMSDLAAVAAAMVERRGRFGNVAAGTSEKVSVATIRSGLPAERVLAKDDAVANMAKINAVVGLEAITAAGGLCAPVTAYYPVMTLTTAARPVRDSMAVFTADRGGIRYVPPPQISDVAATARVTSADGVTTSGSPVVTSASANFQQSDVGGTITGSITGIPAGSTILVVTNTTTATISANATATTASNIFTITRPGPIGYIPMATAAASLGGTLAQQVAAYKPCMHVTCPAAVEILVAALTRCVEFDNFGARAYPEQVQAWLTIALAQWARRAETALLDRMKSSSTQITAGMVVGATRQLVAQIVKAGAYFRNRNRMERDTPLHVWLPEWTIDLAIADLALGSAYDPAFLTQARALFIAGLAEANVNVSWYMDSATGNGQLINSGTKHAAGALVAFPTTCVWYLAAEGSWLFLDGGELDLGLVRDSTLNQSNNYRIFGETWEEAALIGPESLEVTSTVVASGAASGTVTPPAAF